MAVRTSAAMNERYAVGAPLVGSATLADLRGLVMAMGDSAAGVGVLFAGLGRPLTAARAPQVLR